ncbi:MAG: AI-2E family transporter [Caldilineaceae bacterium]
MRSEKAVDANYRGHQQHAGTVADARQGQVDGRQTRLLPETYRPYLAIITVVLVLGAMRMAASVLLPLISAIFLIALFWPLQRRLQHRMSRGFATLITFLVFLVILGLFVGSFWFSGTRVAQRWPQYSEQFQQYLQTAQQYGIPIPGITSDGTAQQGASNVLSNLRSVGIRLLNQLLSFSSALALTIAFMMLGLLEVADFRSKVRQSASAPSAQRWLAVTAEMASDFQTYAIIRTGIGLLNGVLAGVALWLMGVDFAFTWGLLTFLLNYIPTIGSVIAVIPPPLFALVQFDSYGTALLVLVVIGAIQLILGLYVDPLVEGHYLSPSPLVVLLSVTFWGWLWGIAGALLGVPLTILIIIACGKFPRTRWIATLLSDKEDDESGDQDQRGAAAQSAS